MSQFIPVVHRYQATTMKMFVNIFLIETENGVICIDTALSVSAANDVKKMIEEIGKPLIGVLLTHGHPDHYTGIAEITKGLDIPIYSTEVAKEQMISRDKIEGPTMAEVFKEEYPKVRTFPNTMIQDGTVITLDGLDIIVESLGACESHDDTIFIIDIEGVDHIFTGDMIYNKMHSFVHDGHLVRWMDGLDELRDRSDHHTVFHNGHGEDCGIEMVHWQKAYLDAFVDIVQCVYNEKKQIGEEEVKFIAGKMMSFLPTDDLLLFLLYELDKTIDLLIEQGIIDG